MYRFYKPWAAATSVGATPRVTQSNFYKPWAAATSVGATPRVTQSTD